jgi:hypothetical protein
VKELIGQSCMIIFNLPGTRWPIPGYPAFGTVQAVDMPMVKIDGRWLNTSIIEQIQVSGPMRERPPLWVRMLGGFHA